MVGFPQGHALVIGVGAYGDPAWDVPTAARDAEGLAAALIEPGGAAYDPRQVEALTDGRATREGVLAALERLANRAGPDSVALISFTCHGADGTDGAYHLATSEARFTRDQRIDAGSGLAAYELAGALKAIPARHLLLVVNACFAGRLGERIGVAGIDPETLDRPPGAMLPDEAGRELVSSGEGRAVITAGRAGQRSYYLADRPNSFFGRALIDAMGGAGVTAAGEAIGLFELYETLYTQVSGAVRRELGARQEPALTLLQGVGPFAVARAGGREGELRRMPLSGVVREVPPVTVNVTNKRSVISFEGATILGDVRTGDQVEGDVFYFGDARRQGPDDEPLDPVRRLPLLRKRVEAARNVDEDARDDAANKLRQAERALGDGDIIRARQRLAEALAILRAMDNGYVQSVTRKLEELAGAL